MTAQEQPPWVPAFEGQRPPFEPGHDLSLKHGAYAELRLAERAQVLADSLRERMGARYSPAFEFSVRSAAAALAKYEAAMLAVLSGGDVSERLERDAARWDEKARKWLIELGLTPRSAALLKIDHAAWEAGLDGMLERYIAAKGSA